MSYFPSKPVPERKLLERDIEAYLRRRVRALNGKCYKFTSPSRRSVPDDIVKLPLVPAFMVECKRPGQKATKAQAREHESLRSVGWTVYVVDTKELVDEILQREIMLHA